MNNPFTQYEQEVLTALYKSLNYCEEYDLPTFQSKLLTIQPQTGLLSLILVIYCAEADHT